MGYRRRDTVYSTEEQILNPSYSLARDFRASALIHITCMTCSIVTKHCITDPGYTSACTHAETSKNEEEGRGGRGGGGEDSSGGNKKEMVEQQRRSTPSLRWRAALVIRPANNNRSGRSSAVRFGTATSLSLSLLSRISAGRCIATRIGHEEASRGHSRPVRREDGRHAEDEEAEG